jgi:hypothetical protein
MDRTSLRIAALTVTAVLALGSAEAQADSDGALPQAGSTAAEPSPASTTPPAPDAGTALMVAPSASSTQDGAQLDAGSQVPSAQPPAGNQPQSPATSAGTPSTTGGATPTAQSTTQPPSAPSDPVTVLSPPVNQERPAPPLVAPVAAAGPPAAASPVSPVSPGQGVASHDAGTPPPARPAAHGLARVLPRAERELRIVQTQIDDLQHLLDQGALSPPEALTRVRSSLERIAPVLLALNVQLQHAGRLSPHLRELLRRVRDRLTATNASAAELRATLRHAGLRGAEWRLLLHQLQSFLTLRLPLIAAPAVAQAPAPAPAPAQAASGVGPAFVQAQPGAAAVARQPVATPSPAPAAAPRVTGASDRARPAELTPLSSAGGSASVSPGGAFSGPGAATLATLLIGLMLVGLSARLTARPIRRYSAVFAAPLERPG